MDNTIWLIIMISIVLLFIIVAVTDRPTGRFRRDDRDARKADDLNRAGAGRTVNQQASELQVGEVDELRQESRFEPDVTAGRNPR
jgi:hypothetical protein